LKTIQYGLEELHSLLLVKETKPHLTTLSAEPSPTNQLSD